MLEVVAHRAEQQRQPVRLRQQPRAQRGRLGQEEPCGVRHRHDMSKVMKWDVVHVRGDVDDERLQREGRKPEAADQAERVEHCDAQAAQLRVRQCGRVQLPVQQRCAVGLRGCVQRCQRIGIRRSGGIVLARVALWRRRARIVAVLLQREIDVQRRR